MDNIKQKRPLCFHTSLRLVCRLRPIWELYICTSSLYCIAPPNFVSASNKKQDQNYFNPTLAAVKDRNYWPARSIFFFTNIIIQARFARSKKSVLFQWFQKRVTNISNPRTLLDPHAKGELKTLNIH